MVIKNKLDFQVLKNKFRLPKPWDLLAVFLLSILASIPTFIVAHQNLIDLNWYFGIDRIIIFVILLVFFYLIFKQLQIILIFCVLLLILFLIFNSIFGKYGVTDLVTDYNSMMFTMADNPYPQDIIIAKLLPFPNKQKILNAIDYENPRVRNFALMATTKHFQKKGKFQKQRKLIQCFAVFIEIKKRWNYVNDPKGSEYIAKASESLQHFSGDCDDHAILMAACIRAVGGTPRIISTSNHLYPEMLIGSKADFEKANYIIKKVLFKTEIKNKKLHYHIDERGNIWLNLDYTAKYPGGPFMSSEVLGALTLN
jgi:Ca2+/Na+ antiporter